MHRVVLGLSLAAAAALCAWACGSNVNNIENTGGSAGSGTGNTGGTGGATTTSSITPSTSSTSTTPSFANDCEKACYLIEVECAFPVSCGQVPFPIQDCADDLAKCNAACIVDADCAALASMLGSKPDPTLQACLQACNGDDQSCLGCATASCLAELQACQGDEACQAFAQCALGCSQTDIACVFACADDNPSAATDAVVDCAKTKCATQCLGGGGGGAGGAGGNGGTGGTGGT